MPVLLLLELLLPPELHLPAHLLPVPLTLALLLPALLPLVLLLPVPLLLAAHLILLPRHRLLHWQMRGRMLRELLLALLTQPRRQQCKLPPTISQTRQQQQPRARVPQRRLTPRRHKPL